MSIPSHIWDDTVAMSQIFWDLEELMRDGFCDWCAKCAKYLAFGTFERADDSALRTNNGIWFIIFLFIFLSHPNYNITFIFSCSHRLTASISILSYSFFFPFALFSSHSWIMSHHLTNSIIMSHHFTSSIISLIYKISFTGFFFLCSLLSILSHTPNRFSSSQSRQFVVQSQYCRFAVFSKGFINLPILWRFHRFIVSLKVSLIRSTSIVYR